MALELLFSDTVARPPRLQSFDYRGRHQYSLTFCTLDRRRVFVESIGVGACLTIFLQQASTDGFEILVYCFMPDHVHLVIEGIQDSCNLQTFVARAKQLSGFEYAQRTAAGRLWQKGYFETVLRTDDAVQRAMRYVLENPVRAQMVREPLEYPYSGSGKYSKEQLKDLWSDRWHR